MSTIVDSARGPKENAGNFSLLSVFVAIGSLKFTVVLFALSLVTVLVGTLAQDEMNMFEVKQRYFTCWFTQLYFDDFFPHISAAEAADPESNLYKFHRDAE